jgi:5-methylcytosine-specific restriction endonuclease McrA
MDYPKTRKEAKALGASHYFTGEPCTRGHVAPRKTKGVCVECMQEDWTADNERRKLKPKSEAAKAAGRKYYEQNRELVKARAVSRPASRVKKYKDAWKAKNPELVQASANAWKRRAREAAPRWLTPDQKKHIAAIYLQARALTKRTGVKHVVDHIIPLRSEVVCGLHVPWNLQILTHIENSHKSNRLD